MDRTDVPSSKILKEIPGPGNYNPKDSITQKQSGSWT